MPATVCKACGRVDRPLVGPRGEWRRDCPACGGTRKRGLTFRTPGHAPLHCLACARVLYQTEPLAWVGDTMAVCSACHPMFANRREYPLTRAVPRIYRRDRKRKSVSCCGRR